MLVRRVTKAMHDLRVIGAYIIDYKVIREALVEGVSQRRAASAAAAPAPSATAGSGAAVPAAGGPGAAVSGSSVAVTSTVTSL